MISWKQLKKNQWEGITLKFDFYISNDKGSWVLDVFKHKIKDNSKAFIRSFEINSLKDGKESAEDYQKNER